jgi:hypothetical protein
MSTSKHLKFKDFYELADPITKRPLRLTTRRYSDWISRDYTWELFRGKASPEQPIKLGTKMGWQPADFLWSGFVFIVCISSKVVRILNENRVSGWNTYQVDVYGRKGEPLPGYYGLAVTGNECRRDRSRSQIITKQAVPGGKPFEVYKGLYFYEEDWDGSDIFIVRSYGGTIVTEKVKNIFKQAKITNVKLTPLPEVEIQVLLDKFDQES